MFIGFNGSEWPNKDKCYKTAINIHKITSYVPIDNDTAVLVHVEDEGAFYVDHPLVDFNTALMKAIKSGEPLTIVTHAEG